MKLYKRSVDVKTGAGFVKLEPQDTEDMWHLYNIVAVGDRVSAKTTRKVKSESDSGASESQRVKITLTICVTSVDYDSLASGIRVTGRNQTNSDHVRANAFHTIELNIHRAVTVEKDVWDSVYLERIRVALDPAVDADLAAVLMHEGLAHVLLVSRSLTLTRARIETSIPKKGKSAIFNRDSATTKFFDSILRAIIQHIDLNRIKTMLLASPGFLKDEIYKHIMLEANRHDMRPILENKSKIVLCHASSGHKHALTEVLARPELQARLSETKAVKEVQALQQFNNVMAVDENKAFYGPSYVSVAAESGAIRTLLITDELFRSMVVATRRRYVDLVDRVKKEGGEVLVFSTQHVSGLQLRDMSGIAAILRFPMPQVNEMHLEDDDSEDDSSD